MRPTGCGRPARRDRCSAQGARAEIVSPHLTKAGCVVSMLCMQRNHTSYASDELLTYTRSSTTKGLANYTKAWASPCNA